MESIQELPINEVGEYINLNNELLSARLVFERTHEVIIKFSPDYIINEVDELLKQNIWLKYERKSLEMLKELLKKTRGKDKFQLTRIKVENFVKFARYAFEASIERASWVKDKIVTIVLEKEYNKYVSMVLFILNQNIILLKKIKEIEPKNEDEMVREAKKIINMGPKIQESILGIYILIREKSERKEIAEELLNETLECVNEYSSFTEI